ncbi:CAMK family protein kinase [Histomonas meleagridis]|uniref:CAMK family protein kinase n=1 Tax=Histomonas meleagridis TaxID=135588 RepID=UPI003559B6DF|nr:CAMK family protein kinase [Histomonas meleagridis]KAH0799959.1 CAMK family protein kinase [Histomonas meleagridis]
MSFFKVHRYLVGQKIGSGSFSSIRLCFKSAGEHPLVAKITSKKVAASLVDGNRIDFNEKTLSPLLCHPNILAIHEVIEGKSQTFQISDLYEKGDLLQLLRTSGLSKQVIISIADQILAAIEYLHENHICHRDIKLENVLLTDKMGVRLSDLGLAYVTFDDKVTGKCGSYQYVAPEVLTQRFYDGFKADIWSCGVLFFSIFSKRFPYKENEPPTNIKFDALPADVRPLISAMLNIDPKKRPTAKECRKFDVFNSIPVRTPPYMSPFDFDVPIQHPKMDVVSRVSQLISVAPNEVNNQLSKPEPCIEKLLYYLFFQKLQSRHLFKRFKSCPINNKKVFDTFIEKKYRAHSCALMKAINGFLLPFNCCISTAATLNRTIVLNQVDDDSSASFDLVDCDDFECCILTLTVRKECSLFPTKLLAYLDSMFEFVG